ncbi:glycosyltransferase family 2 protein [Terriglobus sp.]|uniref:glycosyltransferase family 2 protein n=1 Tax=Terriglobus sp. TaxID=1889013 RepID=UPI003B0099F1
MEKAQASVPGGSAKWAGRATIVIPTYNGATRIGHCLQSLLAQTADKNIEILVIDDGSTDNTVEIVQRFGLVRVVSQSNAGPAAARNRGAQEAHGEVLLFTDDDCIPFPDWVEAMLAPFTDPAVVGVKGIYRTTQAQLTARFVQLEYEDKYRIMAAQPSIDFIDTYSAGFVRQRFLEAGGYDTSFPVACAEDVELSFRMSSRNWLMKFIPCAVVYHSHPGKPIHYFRKKFKFAYWRVLAVRKNPSKAVKDSHTPQLMKLQLLLLPMLVMSLLAGVLMGRVLLALGIVAVAFGLTTIPFAFRALRKDVAVGSLSPLFLAGRSVAQFLGVVGGTLYTLRNRAALLPVIRTR